MPDPAVQEAAFLDGPQVDTDKEPRRLLLSGYAHVFVLLQLHQHNQRAHDQLTVYAWCLVWLLCAAIRYQP